jgi:tRNA A-37 threonylcarbamoyl transferase component Bud32
VAKLNTYFHLISDTPDFTDLPWNIDLNEWSQRTKRYVQVECGLSRHPIAFVNYDSDVYAIKELPPGIAQKEFRNLLALSQLRLPTVETVGYVESTKQGESSSLLITKYLESSIPYRSIFLRSNLDRYKSHILDAMAGLLVQLHLNGVYWGDCSCSNTLFRRDAGTLQAYLVDAETVELNQAPLKPTDRAHDIAIMQENILGEFSDINISNNRLLPFLEIGDYIRKRYQELWEEITREIIIKPEEQYRVQDHITSLNQLGFSIKDIEIFEDETGDKLRLRVNVTDKNFHRDQLFELTGLVAEEMQARQMINEIQQLRAVISRKGEHSIPLSVAAHEWLIHIYEPIMKKLQPILNNDRFNLEVSDPSELYCQILENKWFLSEKVQQDIGHQAAADDYLNRFISI